MCIKNFIGEKIIFDKFTAFFNLDIFQPPLIYNTAGRAYFMKSSPPSAFIVIPPAKRSFRGVYCFQPVRDSVIPSFRDSVIPSFRHSVNIWTSLLNNLSSFCLICFKFSPHLHHQTIHVWYEFRGQRVSIARVMGLFKSSYNMFAIVLKVHTL